MNKAAKHLCLAKALTWGLFFFYSPPWKATFSFLLTNISIIFYSFHLKRGIKINVISRCPSFKKNLFTLPFSLIPSSVSFSHLSPPFQPPSFLCPPLRCLNPWRCDVSDGPSVISCVIWCMRVGVCRGGLHGPQIQKVNGISGRGARLEQQHTAQFIRCSRFL